MVTSTISRPTRRWFALAAVSLAVLAVGFDGTILSVALPTLATRLHATESDLEWFSAAYLVVLAASVLPAGLIGDRVGRKKTLLVSLALFGVGSAWCAVSTSPAEFIAARVLLGMAGAGVTVMATSALTVLFTPAERPRAIGVFAASNFIALPLGPILGGWMLSHFWWGWLFLVNVPLVILGLAVGLALVPESRGDNRNPIDVFGIVASAIGLVTVTAGFVQAGENGWGDAGALALIGSGLAALVVFFLWQRRLARRSDGFPLLDIELFSFRSFTWGAILGGVVSLGLIGTIFTMPQYFQAVQGDDAQTSGLRLLPLIGGLILGAVPASRVARLLGTRIAAAIGFAAIGIGAGVGAASSVSSPVWFVAGWMAVVGFGVGLALATCTSAALSNLTPGNSGIGSAVVQVIQKAGAPLGSAVLGSVLSVVYQSKLQLSGLPSSVAGQVRHSVFSGVAVAGSVHSTALLESVRSSFVAGESAALIVTVGIAGLGCIVALVFLPRALAPSPAENPVAANAS
jgi:DHA2 family multidrug resistance protein-like MFS transporter